MPLNMLGGCEMNPMTISIAAIVIVASLLMLYYIITYINSEGMCGDHDQMCEPLKGNKNSAFSEANLSQAASGY